MEECTAQDRFSDLLIKFIYAKSTIDIKKDEYQKFFEEYKKHINQLKETTKSMQKLTDDKVGLIEKLKLFKEKIQRVFKWKRVQTDIEKEKLPFQCQLLPNAFHEKLKDTIKENNELKNKIKSITVLGVKTEIKLNTLCKLIESMENKSVVDKMLLCFHFSEILDAMKIFKDDHINLLSNKIYMEGIISSLQSKNDKLMEEKIKLQETTNDLKSDLLRKESDLKKVEEKCCKLQEQLAIAHSRKTNNEEFKKRMLDTLLSSSNRKRKMENQLDESSCLKKNKCASNQFNVHHDAQNLM